ncbi:MAG: 1,4-dihydroxy-2-naphthoate octaprenyltransferase [Muribaculaceae bacterium]|nr:1,4-dihydroxy-2-naphthoate octaprenyltransferase [Muribaculaceae bacterium]
MIKHWIEAMRLRTLPVSLAGVIMAWGFNFINHNFNLTPAILCLLFALLAQISSNFANEYYDFKSGLDRKGRDGHRRGVTEGDITPRAMKMATYGTLALACAVGCSLIYYGGWWLLPMGIVIALGAMAYSAGPYPLSRHGLGEVAVLFFFGIIPVTLTYYVQSLEWNIQVLFASISVGLMGANVLIVNNYRDHDDDKNVGKRTLAVIFGRKVVANLYLFNGFIAVALMAGMWSLMPVWSWAIPVLYLVAHTAIWIQLNVRTGSRLNPLLGMTAMVMAAYSLLFAITAAVM